MQRLSIPAIELRDDEEDEGEGHVFEEIAVAAGGDFEFAGLGLKFVSRVFEVVTTVVIELKDIFVSRLWDNLKSAYSSEVKLLLLHVNFENCLSPYI